jgi:mono/diheme cytochrome c family protein
VGPATVAAGALACAAAAMVVAAFAAGDGDGEGERAATAPATTATRDGLAVWVANGCGSCHTFRPANARAVIGPDLAATLQGMPASYIRESIVNPRAAAAAGWEGGIMPEDFGRRIPPAELERLVEFIRAGVPD